VDDGWLSSHRHAVEDAAVRIAAYVRRTPMLECDLDPSLLLKPECLQRAGSFKVRGAFNAILRLMRERPEVRSVAAVSSGNHAQAVALAARTLGLGCVVIMPQGSNPAKVKATLALGAEVVSEGVTTENREQQASELAAERGLVLVHPFADWDVVHGQGTAGLELVADRPDVGLVAVPVGGGGLIGGTALVAASQRPPVRVIGVEPAAADDAARSLRERRPVRLERGPRTIADGVRSLALGAPGYEVAVERGLVEAIVTVTEQEIEAAVTLAAARLHLVVEPSGALPLAAWLGGRMPTVSDGRATALLLSGGNVDPRLLARLLDGDPDR